MEEELDAIVTRDIGVAQAELRAGNEVIIPLHLLKQIYLDVHRDLMNWPQFETGIATVPHDGKKLLYILLKPVRKLVKFYREIPVSDVGE